MLDQIVKRVGPELEMRYSGRELEIIHHGIKLSPENKGIGPTERGFILRLRQIGNDISAYTASEHPFDWIGYPVQDQYPWSAEFHYLRAARHEWMIVAVWYGPGADQDLIREIVTAISKHAEIERKHFYWNN